MPTGVADALVTNQLPSDLQRLLAAEQHLHLAGYVWRATTTKRGGHGSATVSSSVWAGRVAPAQLSLTATTNNQTVTLRLIVAYGYVNAPGLAGIDGGYPWVSAPGDFGGVNFGGLVQDEVVHGADLTLGVADKVSKVGVATIGGQPTTEFIATSSLTQTTTRLFFAADGLVVRSIASSPGKTTTSNVSPAAPPVASPPSSRETIPESRLSSSVRKRVERYVNNALPT